MKNYKIAFYTEAGTTRGMGHLIRSYTIYQEFKKEFKDVSFFLDSDIDFGDKFNDITYFKWNDFTLDTQHDIIFIDSYEADIELYKTIANSCKVAIYIDDYGRLDYPKGVIINFAPDSEKLFFKTKNPIHTYLLGLKYIPIREKFLKINEIRQQQIFIMLGGTDTANLSMELIDALKEINIKKVIVLNNKNNIEKIQKFNNVKVLYKPTDTELISNMANSSLAISTASMTLYELSYLKIPTIIIAVSKNQSIGMKQSIENKIAILGLSVDDNNWKESLNNFIKQQKYNQYLDKILIDGIGTQRIINKTIKLIA